AALLQGEARRCKDGAEGVRTDGLVAAHQLDAGKWVKQVVAPLIKGGGGGQKNLAAAGGQDAQGIQPVIEAIRQQLTELA
ncbi:MAG: DHHA1 domain-containing protein, partial [Chitinophagaceae bacterium]|nr:DHHA1 domain-containing protein [Chitinophagaceae bacterium]